MQHKNDRMTFIIRDEMESSDVLRQLFEKCDTDKWSSKDHPSGLSIINYTDVVEDYHINEKDDTYEIDYKSSVNPSVEHLRGIVLDPQQGYVVAKSFKYTEQQVVTKENFEKIRKNNCFMGIEGTVLRVFKHGGVVYFSTHKNLDATRSRWGSSKTFVELYHELGGIKPELLFPEDVANGRYCYIFIIVHASTIVCSKLPIGDGYLRPGFIMYIGNVDVSSDVKISKHDTIFTRSYEPINIETSDIMDYITGKSNNPIVRPKQLNFEEAVNFLFNGFNTSRKVTDYTSETNLHGEFIIVTDNDLSYNSKIIKYCSKEYMLRLFIRDGNPNLYHQYFILKDELANDETQHSLLSNLDKLVRSNISIIPECFIPDVQILKEKVLVLLAYTVPLSSVKDVITYGGKYMLDMCEFIRYYSELDIFDTDTPLVVIEARTESRKGHKFEIVLKNMLMRTEQKSVYTLFKLLKRKIFLDNKTD